MNARLEPIAVKNKLNHLIRFVLVYPLGQLPPDVKPEDIPDDALIGVFEDYICEFSATPPTLNTVHELNGNCWTVADIQTYTTHQPHHPTQNFYIAICSQNGQIPERNSFLGKPPVLYIPVLNDGQLPHCEDGTSYFGLADKQSYVPAPGENDFSDWVVTDIQWFQPIERRASFDQVAICWCRN